ncbi:MAG: holo-[acyl-carrier-protein] synthase [Planctomycetes bacterium]|nr:holo-[acyl-carrier-protein] synthase [Planctomycetota bacterium]
MILGLGTDLVELDRLQEALDRRGEALLERLFTARERAALQGDPQLVRRAAARFAAKEAALKALGTGWGQGLSWHDIEVLGGRGQPPVLELGGAALERLRRLGGRRAHVTLTHTERLAAATVVLE